MKIAAMPLASAVLLVVVAGCVWCQSIPPQSGVLLYSEALEEIFPNNSLIKASSIGGVNDGVACYTAADNADGTWETPNGNHVIFGTTSMGASHVFFAQSRPHRVTMVAGGVAFSSVDEGVYTCRIRDENSVRQTLYIGVYTSDTYQSSAGPVVHTPTFSLLTPLTTRPSIFTVTCPTDSTPPTSVLWKRDGGEITTDNQFETSQVLVNGSTSRYDNILKVNDDLVGVYQCEVGNVRGDSVASVTVEVPSGPPTGLQARQGGRGSVKVTWNPPAGAKGYLLLYRPSTAEPSQAQSITIDNATATSHLIDSVVAETEYTIEMLAFAELPTSLSAPTTITLDVPGQPQNVQATPISSSEVRVQWDPPDEEGLDGYVVLYEPAPGVSCEAVQGGEVRVEGGEVTEWVVTGLEGGMNYSLRVRASNFAGEGEPSEPATATTMEEAPSGPPLSVRAVASSPTSITVSWLPPDCLSWNSHQLSRYSISYQPLPPSQEEGGERGVVSGVLTYNLTGLSSFTNYSVSVAASNDQGGGPLSEETYAALVDAPGSLESVTYHPDILSAVISWEPPAVGRGWITMVMVGYYNSVGVKLGSDSVAGTQTSYRLTDLQPVSSYHVFLTPYTAHPLSGPASPLNILTLSIGKVTSVKVIVLNSTAVNITWTPLPSRDVTAYIVYYSRILQPQSDVQRQTGTTEMFVTFPVVKSEGWGVIGGLEEGEYQFSVVASVTVGDVKMEGERAETAAVTVKETAGDDGGLSQEVIIIIAVVAAVLLLVLLLGGGVILVCCCIRRYRRSGKMEVYSAMELRPHPKPLPLPDFDQPRIDVASSRPEIIEDPMDVIAIEGERVDFKLKVAGSPRPTIVWYHGACMVGPDYATQISDDGDLTFISVEPTHAGVYRYTVSNTLGSVQGQVILYVHSEMNRKDRVGLEPPKITSYPVSLESFGTYVEEKRANQCRGLRDQFLCLSTCEEGHSTSIALSPSNKKYNRFQNIVAYDEHRVKLKAVTGRQDCQHDYINASYIDGYGVSKKFVATQGPVDTTIVDFWRMIWQLHAPTIVMTTNLDEGRKKKCERYWPEYGTAEYGPYSVTLAEQQVLADYVIRKLTVTSSNSSRHVHYITHCQFTSWPDHEVPDYVAPMLEFHRRVREEHRPNKGPIVVHCSAGVGRTGAFITLDIALQQAQSEGQLDIPLIITKLRSQRMKMIQTVDQYVFLHDALMEGLMCGNTRIEAANLEQALAKLLDPDPTTGQSQLEEQFNTLDKVTPRPDPALCSAAQMNPERNRNMDYLPTDRWRVVLTREHPDYIHASFAGSYRQKRAFIIAQAPMEETCRDFWKMVYERECGVIVMLSGLVEDNKAVCHQYWPGADLERYGEYAVSVAEEERVHDGFLERVFTVTDSKTEQAHRVTQFQVLGWARDGHTSKLSGIVGCMSRVETAQRKSGNAPIVVHCSDCVTRSGMFCAGMATIECCKVEATVDVFQAVRALRHQRPGAVPHLGHYRLLHELVLTFVQGFSTYSNFK